MKLIDKLCDIMERVVSIGAAAIMASFATILIIILVISLISAIFCLDNPDLFIHDLLFKPHGIAGIILASLMLFELIALFILVVLSLIRKLYFMV